MKIEDLVGTFSIIGSNQDQEAHTYKGILQLSLDTDNRIVAKWTINDNQEQTGNGFFKDNILVIHFKYIGFKDIIYKGTVVYKCLNNDILEGFWSEEYGDPQFLGSENCFRIKDHKELPN